MRATSSAHFTLKNVVMCVKFTGYEISHFAALSNLLLSHPFSGLFYTHCSLSRSAEKAKRSERNGSNHFMNLTCS
jgi:hypothetical protein